MSTRNRWMERHLKDPYVKLAQKEGYRSRAAYKLLEIQEKDHILKKGMSVVDLGAAPGGWLQVVLKHVGEEGRILALDLRPIDVMAEVEFIQGDFTEDAVLEKVLKSVDNRGVDLVMSDMAPDITGLASVDIPRGMYLSELAFEFAKQVLHNQGDFLVKVFQGEGFSEFHKSLNQSFQTVKVRKPKSSRSSSREVYLLGKGFKED